MMFLQFFTWGAWFATLGLALNNNGLEDVAEDAYMSAPIAAIIAPLFLGLIADRFFPSQVIMGILLLIGGALLLVVPGYGTPETGGILVWLCIGHMLCYMPTLGLANTIAFANLADQNEFPKIRVWGTIGWIVAGLIVGFLGWSAEFEIFQLAGGCALLLGLYSFTLPHTPPPAAGKPVNLAAILMFDAMAMFRSVPFLVFMICSTLICIPLAYYYVYCSIQLGQLGFDAPASTMTLGQMSEVFFMILIPFFLRRLGVKWMILIGMGAWALRYLLFAYGASEQLFSLVLIAILLHGVCYDFFFVTGFIYTDKKAPADVRGQAQSMLVFFTQGIGMLIGYQVAGAMFKTTVTNNQALTDSLSSIAPDEQLSFGQSLQRVLSVSRPEVPDPQLYIETMEQWKEFWLLPAGMSLGILVLFALLFHDRVIDKESTEVPVSPEVPASTDE